MKKFKMIFKILGLIAGSALALLLIVGALFINLSPEFGGSASDEQKLEYAKSGHFENDKFVNEIPTELDMSFSKGVEIMREMSRDVPNRQPSKPIPVLKLDSMDIVGKSKELNRITWFGHSAFLLEIDGKNILIDPMLGDVPAPHPMLGSPRFNEELPIAIDKLPKIDAVIISHDHYDHLDYGSIKELKEKVDQFYMPLGVGNHLRTWDVEDERIHELNWWDEIEFGNFTFVCTPSRHFSGRGLFDRASTMWSSWIIQTDSLNIYFSGDGGYGPHFKQIGEKYGPFDFAMMECGQYNENWSEIHMMPEETAQAGVDVQALRIMPIHWGSFRLALHSWTDPVVRVTAKAQELKLPITTPKIGESIIISKGESVFPEERWWEAY